MLGSPPRRSPPSSASRPALLLARRCCPHALPELIALFLPLAAWIIASRRGEWDQLLAATFVTVAIAVPILVVAAFVEVYVSPHLFAALARVSLADRARLGRWTTLCLAE